MIVTMSSFHFSIFELSYKTFIDIIIFVLNFYGFILNTKILSFAMNAGVTTKQEVKMTSNIVHKIINSNNDKRIIKKVGYLSK